MNILKNESGDLSIWIQLLLFIILVVIAVGLIVGITWGAEKLFQDDPVIITDPIEPSPLPQSFTVQDFLIVPETIGGFHIQEWPVASYDDPESLFEVQLLIKGVGYTRGPVYNTRDEAETQMIWMAGECGL